MLDIFNINDTEFSAADFKSPSETYHPVYAWFWNGPITDEESEKQLLEMQRLGIRALYIVCEPKDFRPNGIPTLTDPNYLTEPYFERYAYVVRRASELGMKFWLYDEGGWPSGGACGLVMYDHPEYAKRTLDKRTISLRAGVAYEPTDENAFAAFINGSTEVKVSEIFDTDTDVCEYYSRRIAFEVPGKPDVPDATLPEATDYFIKLTHEQYKKHLGNYFGNTITAVFTDEPLAPPIPFRDELVREYEKKYGESPLKYLPAIFGDVCAEGDALTAKIRWFDLSSQAFCDNFLLKCKSWANENGLAFTGHMDRDDEPRGSVFGKCFNVMRAMRSMDVPGIDVIWRQIFPNINGKKYENRFYPRYASSAAAQIGKRLAMTETFGVYGNGLTFDQMRFIVGFQAIRGVTLFNPMKISYARRAIWLAGELPSFEEDYACYAHLGHFNKYLERLSYVMTRGERVTKTALYYPINSFWADVSDATAADEFDALGFEMESLGVDFDIVDDDVILASETTADGAITMGRARYEEIVVPSSAILTDEVKAALEKFKNGGGRIISTAKDATKTVKLLSGDGEIIASKKATADGSVVCLFNQSIEKKTVTIAEEGDHAYLINITVGEIFPLEIKEGKITVSLESGESAAIYITERIIPTAEEPVFGNEISLADFGFKRKISFTFGEMLAHNEEIEEEPVKAELGNWAPAVGKEFSGTCSYVTSFSGVNSDALLDLGDVRHTAEVILNGKSIGVKIMKPYVFHIKKELLSEENDLEIRVTNTVANQQHYSKTFDKWKLWQLTDYTTKQNAFDEDSLDSGLYGPVTLSF